MEREQIIAELLGIRSGLSIISKCYDEIKKEEKLINIKTQELVQKESELKKIENTLIQCKEYDQRKREFERKIDSNSLKNEAKERAKKNTYVIIDSKNRGANIVLCGVICGAIFGLLGHTIKVNAFGGSLAIIGLLVGLFSYPLFSVITLPLRIKSESSRIEKELKQSYQESIEHWSQKLVSTAMENTNKGGNIVVKDLNDLLSIRSKYEEEIKQKKEELKIIKETAEKVINLAAEKSETVAVALRNTYSSVITESDWQNIDLLIHYFETGRADTVKEALKQVDQQKQTDQIVRSIKEASDSMSFHIESAFSKMGKVLSISFNKLSNNIDSLVGQLKNNEKTMSCANQRMLTRMDNQLSALEMQNILIEKVNKSSDELLRDLRYNQQFLRK